jgi:hypothetical protein
MRFLLVLFTFALLLVSGCHHSDFHKTHYPKSLKNSRHIENERDALTVINVKNQSFTVQIIDEFNEQNSISDSIETDSNNSAETVGAVGEWIVEKTYGCPENPNSIIWVEQNYIAPTESNGFNQITIEEEPVTKSTKKRTFNKKSVLAFWMVWIMLAAGILIVILIFSDAMFLAGFLLLGVIVGCIFTISRASQGAKEISNDRENQKGTFLSVLAILGSILGLILSGVVAAILFNY